MDSRTFWTHWVIGICAVIIWAWGDKLGIAATLQTYSAYTLPLLVGHAVGRSNSNRPADPQPTPEVSEPPPAQPEQPTTTQGSLT